MKLKENASHPEQTAARVREILNILHKWGIHTLGDFAQLHKDEINARFGSLGVLLWERANGKSIRLLKFVQPPESFRETFEFEYEIETVEPLLFILRRFLEQLRVRLNDIYFLTKELALEIDFANKQTYRRDFKIPQPTNDVELLFRMLYTHLENFKSDHPILAVSLEAQPIKPAPQQYGLFETALRDPNQLYETLARLTALVGTDRVGTPVLNETHRPDSFQLQPFAWELSDSSVESQPLRRAALRRFRPSLSASVLLEENRPLHVRSSQVQGRVNEQNGPYVGSGNWWDELLWSRWEWDLFLGNGTLIRCHENETGWQIDGIYD